MKRSVFLDYDQDELDRAYDQRVWADNAEEVIEYCRLSSAAARAATRHHADLRYGPGADETLDIFLADAEAAPLHVHVHGGAWRLLSKNDASFLAPVFTAAGIHLVVPNFTNLPGVRMPTMVDQLVRAVSYVHAHAASFGADRECISISGHSSGAHLSAVLLAMDWTKHGLPRDLLKTGLCVSGIYDLQPVLLSARRNYVKLSLEEAESLSPHRHADSIGCPVTVIYGERESPEFVRQAKGFAATLSLKAKRVELIEAPGFNHFDMLADFGRKGSLVSLTALRQAGLATQGRAALVPRDDMRVM